MTPAVVAPFGTGLAPAPTEGSTAPGPDAGVFAGVLEGLFEAFVEDNPSGEAPGGLPTVEPEIPESSGSAEPAAANDDFAALLLAFDQPLRLLEEFSATSAGTTVSAASGEVTPAEPGESRPANAPSAPGGQPEGVAFEPRDVTPEVQKSAESDAPPAPAPQPETLVADAVQTTPAAFEPQSGGHAELEPGARRTEGQLETNAAPPAPETPASDGVVRFVGNADTHEEKPGHKHHPAGSDQAGTASTPLAGLAPSSAAQVYATAASGEVDAPSAAPVEMPPAVHQVGEAILERVDEAGGEAVIRLDPPELGSVHIRVTLAGDTVQVQVEAEQPEAQALLREHIEDLSNLLTERGLNLADVQVGQGGHGQQQSQEELPAWSIRRRSGDNTFARLLGLEPPSAARTHVRLQAAYNPDGQYFYRI